MNNRIVILLAGLLAGLLAFPAAAQEQPAASQLRVATAVPARILPRLLETEAQQRRLEARRRQFEEDQRERRERLADLEMARDEFNPGHAQWRERHDELLRATFEAEVWARTQQLEAQRMQKEMTINLFNRIQEGVGEVARQRGIHLVISEPEIPHIELVEPQDLRMLLNQRNLLYAADSVDISDDVVRLLNERYQAGG